jgi:hypothetical protein
LVQPEQPDSAATKQQRTRYTATDPAAVFGGREVRRAEPGRPSLPGRHSLPSRHSLGEAGGSCATVELKI